MVKRIASILILVLVLIALVAPVALVLGEGPEDEESFSELPVEVQEEIEKQLKNPVKPKIRPPFTGSGSNNKEVDNG